MGRVLRRSGVGEAVVETCLAVLGDPQAKRTKEIEDALGKVHAAWAGRPDLEIRAAQAFPLTCRDGGAEPRVRAAYERYLARPPSDLPRRFGGSGLPKALPTRNWVCFYLARTLGNLGSKASAEALMAVLEKCPAKAASGRPDPMGPACLFIHNDLTPCYRAAAASALGRLGDRRAVPVLVKVIANLDNAPDTRHAAAVALGRLAEESDLGRPAPGGGLSGGLHAAGPAGRRRGPGKGPAAEVTRR